QKTNDSAATVNFDIEELKLRAMDYTYLLGNDKFELKGFVEDLNLSGGVDDNGLSLSNRVVLDLRSLKYENKTYIENQHTKLEGDINLNNKYSELSFSDFKLSFGEIELPIDGKIFNTDDHWNVDLKTSNNTNLKNVLTVLSDEVKEEFDSYNLRGKLAYDASLVGAMKKDEVPLLRINFQVDNGKVEERTSGVTLDNLYFKGAYQSLQKGSERMEIEELKGVLAGGTIAVSGGIENFENPWLNLNLNSEIKLGALQQFLKIDHINEMHGNVLVKTHFKGPFPSKEVSRAKLDKLKMSGDMEFNDLVMTLKDGNQSFEQLSGSVVFDDSDLNIQNLTGSLNGSPFEVEGNLRGFVQYVFDKQDQFNLDAKISSPHLDLNALLAENSEDGDANINLDNKLNLNLDAKIDKLTYKNFIAENINGNVKIIEGALHVNNVSFNSAEGSVKGNLSIKKSSENSFVINSSTNIQDIDISEIFNQFDQFGQEFIQSKHLKGIGNAELTYQSVMNRTLDIDPKSIVCHAELAIRDGELINHEAMKDIYIALNDNKLVKPFVRLVELKNELTHLKFSTLKNTISIKNENISIPEMTIASNAMNINISGQHDFKNNIDYKFNFKLSDILLRKNESEFGIIADDGTGAKLFMRMHGTTKNPKFEMDRQKAKESRQEQFIAEKATLKNIIKEELFKKGGDSTPKDETKAIITIEVDSEIDEGGQDAKKAKTDIQKKTAEKTKIDFFDEGDETDDDDF
ncbi:MAG: hypothetical protein ACI9L7_000823, partial [Candidatus Azotimanducaceae bacterium]